MTDLLELALNDLVPSFAHEQPDWADVLARSMRSTRRQPVPSWRRHPRRTVAVALALVLIALLATPAFGVQGYVLHLLGRKNVSFTHSPAAPNVVKKQFLDLLIGERGARRSSSSSERQRTRPVARRCLRPEVVIVVGDRERRDAPTCRPATLAP